MVIVGKAVRMDLVSALPLPEPIRDDSEILSHSLSVRTGLTHSQFSPSLFHPGTLKLFISLLLEKIIQIPILINPTGNIRSLCLEEHFCFEKHKPLTHRKTSLILAVSHQGCLVWEYSFVWVQLVHLGGFLRNPHITRVNLDHTGPPTLEPLQLILQMVFLPSETVGLQIILSA